MSLQKYVSFGIKPRVLVRFQRLKLLFACLRGEMADIDQFYPIEFINLLRALDMYKIGVTANGDPITLPQFMLDAEKSLEQSV